MSSQSVHPVQVAAHRYVGAFLDGLVQAGLRHVVVCPGSRSTPLALLAMDREQLKVWTHIDERSAAYFALGLAKATGEPAALVATSGTAVANFLPAVTEAFFGRVPMVLLTADRPPELRDVGTNQTIFQAGIFGDHVKWSVDMPLPEASDELTRYARGAAARAVAVSKASPAGPVQLNFPFREPLIPMPDSGEAPETTGSPAALGASASAADALRERALARYRRFVGSSAHIRSTEVWEGVRTLSGHTVAVLASEWSSSRRPLFVCGPDTPDTARQSLLDLAARLGAPLLADPLSGLRTAGRLGRELIDAYDVFLRFDTVRDALPPSLVVRFGAPPVSKSLLQYLQHYADAPQIVIDEGGGWRDPTATATRVIHADVARLCTEVLQQLEDAPSRSANPWPIVWRRLNDVTRDELGGQLRRLEEPFEGLVFDALSGMKMDGVHLYVGNSMPIRDFDAFFPATDQSFHVYGNRGVSGIDGLVSSALGVHAAGGAPTLLVLGDLSFYHDLNGLLAASLHKLDLTIIVVNNDGGGIFSFLPQARYGRHFEQLFGTPTGLDFAPVVSMYGGEFIRSSDIGDVRSAVESTLRRPGLHIIEYTTDRHQNAARQQAIMSAVGAKLAEELGAIFRSAGGGP